MMGTSLLSFAKDSAAALWKPIQGTSFAKFTSPTQIALAPSSNGVAFSMTTASGRIAKCCAAPNGIEVRCARVALRTFEHVPTFLASAIAIAFNTICTVGGALLEAVTLLMAHTQVGYRIHETRTGSECFGTP
jgi:hypothetical protein